MRMTFNRDGDLLTCAMLGKIKDIKADCTVRNELNGWRPLHDPKRGKVIRAMNEDPHWKPPVMPRQIPLGIWDVGKPRPRDDEYRSPYYIPTDAEQYLDVWELDENGLYDYKTGVQVLDKEYGLHFCLVSSTTVGCVRIVKERDLLWLVERIYDARKGKDDVVLQVTEG